MPLREPALCVVDVPRGTLHGASGTYTRMLSDLRGLYADDAAYRALLDAGDRIVYEVAEYRPSSAPGDMILGVTHMRPGKVGQEYFLTRGHLHANPNRHEIYYGESGQGVMLMESPAGDVRTAAIGPRTLCYVPPYWIHRTVNTGAEPLVMTFAYPADAGQDYGVIDETHGMRWRIVADSTGGWVAVANTAYRPRPAARVDSILAHS